jgi:hypothetical protein
MSSGLGNMLTKPSDGVEGCPYLAAVYMEYRSSLVFDASDFVHNLMRDRRGAYRVVVGET